MPESDKITNNRLSSTTASHETLADVRKPLLEQNVRLRTHLKRAMLFVTISALVVVIHQAYVVYGYPASYYWHSVAHIAILAVTAALIVGAWLTWFSYLKLHHQQQTMLDAYTHSEEISKKTGESLRESETLLESLFGAITDRIVVVDSLNHIVKANKIARSWAGCDPTHREFSEIFPTCDSQGERRNELSLIEFTRESRGTHRGRLLRGGADCSMLLSVDTYPVDLPDNDSSLVISVARDVTDQTRDDLASRHREKMAALGIMAAGVAHDLGNPLASLSSELDILHDRDPETYGASMAAVREHVGRIKRKLRDIVEFAQPSSNGNHETNVRNAINRALKLTHYDPRARQVQFGVEVDEEMSPALIKQDDLILALVNLIINAFDAMPRGGRLSLNASVAAGNNAVLLSVTDTGMGMDASTLQQAVLPLFTTKDGHDSKGTGLGLTMVHQLIDAAGGELTLQSNPGQGTCATLRIPLADEDCPRTERKAS